MLEILKRIQSDMADMTGRLERVEANQRRLRRDSAAMLVMVRGAAGILEERLTAIAEDVRALKERRT